MHLVGVEIWWANLRGVPCGMTTSTLALLLTLVASPSHALVLSPVSVSRVAPAPRLAASSALDARVRVGGVRMQEGERQGKTSRGRTAVIQRPKPKPKNENREDVDKEASWRVLLHNDDVSSPSHNAALILHPPACSHKHMHPCLVQVHTFDYVSMAIVKVVKTITRKKAHRITVQCHSMGTATVTTTWKQMAKTMCLKLQKFGLTSSIAPE